jgi:hypothetical protein
MISFLHVAVTQQPTVLQLNFSQLPDKHQILFSICDKPLHFLVALYGPLQTFLSSTIISIILIHQSLVIQTNEQMIVILLFARCISPIIPVL